MYTVIDASKWTKSYSHLEAGVSLRRFLAVVQQGLKVGVQVCPELACEQARCKRICHLVSPHGFSSPGQLSSIACTKVASPSCSKGGLHAPYTCSDDRPQHAGQAAPLQLWRVQAPALKERYSRVHALQPGTMQLRRFSHLQ